MKSIKSATRAALSAVLALSASVFATNASAVPVKIETENITFYGDVDPDLAMERVRKWEIYRRMVFALSGIANPPTDPTPLTIYGFYDTDELGTFTANRQIAGVYTQGIKGPIFLTSINNKYTEDGFSEQVGLHEYTHHILSSVVTQGFPRWYNEGFANYLATMAIGEDMVAVGDPSAGHVKSMKEGRVDAIPVETVLSANSFYPNYSRREWRMGGPVSFYAQATIYVHFLRNNPEYADKLAEYLKLVDTPGISPLEAFEQSHGISPKKFHREAMRYYRDDKFVVTQYQPGPNIMDVDFKVERLSEGELRIAQIPARLAFLSDRNENDFRRDLQVAYEKDATNPLINYGYVTMNIRDENYEEAVTRAEAALSGNPDEPNLLRAAAEARFQRYAGPIYEEMEDTEEYIPFKMTEDVQKAVSLYKTILEDDPVDYDSIRSLVSIYGNTDVPIDDDIFQAARILDLRYMDSFNVQWGMSLATIYAKRGFTLDACDYYQKSISETEQFRKNQMGSFKGRLDWFGENYGQSCSFLQEN